LLKPSRHRASERARLLNYSAHVDRPDDRDHQYRSASQTRGRLRLLWDLVFGWIRFIRHFARNVYAIFGIFLLSGAAIAIVCTWAFSEIAERVRAGGTQSFDNSVMQWMAAHQSPQLQTVMLEVTSLGTGTVVTMIVLIAGLFLWLNHHKHSAILLAAATIGGIVLDELLKIGFNRPRPQVFKWGTYAVSSSFPSGHAMSSIVVYGTVAYLAARLQQNVRSRILTMSLAAIIIILICLSRLYLGVHYPSDVLAGLVIGLAWAAFCMAMLEALQLYAKYNEPQMLEDERPAAKGASPST
jgi:undecaprenyl-diphosphatase